MPRATRRSAPGQEEEVVADSQDVAAAAAAPAPETQSTGGKAPRHKRRVFETFAGVGRVCSAHVGLPLFGGATPVVNDLSKSVLARLVASAIVHRGDRTKLTLEDMRAAVRSVLGKTPLADTAVTFAEDRTAKFLEHVNAVKQQAAAAKAIKAQ